MIGTTHCPHKTNDDIDPQLREAILHLEAILGREIKSNSCVRCPDCNKAVGGEDNSAHLRGLAVDISCDNSMDRYNVIKALIKQGICRFGIGHSFIHADIDATLPQYVVWEY